MRLAVTGRRAEAFPISEEAVALGRKLVGLNRDAYLPGLAASLVNHANRLAETGRQAEAVPVSEEAVALYDELAGLNRDAYLADYTQSLATLGYVLIEDARLGEAIEPLIGVLSFGRELPKHKQGIVAVGERLLRRAYSDDPVIVAEQFRALIGQDLPLWVSEQLPSQE